MAPPASRITSAGVLSIAGEFDEFTGAPVVDSSLKLWLDAGQTTSYPGTGTTWADLSGNGRTGTLTGGPTYSTTNGGSIVFDGTNDYVSCTGSLTVTEATFVAWIRRDGTQNPYDGIIFCRGTGSNVSGLNIGQTGTSNEIGYHWHGQSSSYFFTSNLTIPNLTWCMIAVSVTSTAATLYLCQSSGITTATNTTSHPSTLLSNIHIGQDNVPPLYDRWFKGNIASAQIYNRALTAAEITQNYNALQSRYGLTSVTATQMPVVQRQQSSGTLLINGEFDEFTGAPVVDSSLKLWLDSAQTTSYPGSGTTWTDLSGNGNNGTLNNGVGFNGSNGGGLVFDGSDDYVDLNTNNIITGTNPFTFSCFYTITALNSGGEIFGNYGVGYTTNYLWIAGEYGVYLDGSVYFPGAPISVGTYHMAVTRDSGGSVILYKNGVQVASGTLASSIAVGPNFRLGADVTGSATVGGERLNGKIYNQMVYNRALTAAEIVQNYNALQSRYGLESITATQMPVVQRQQSSGTLLVNGEFDEVNMILQNADLYFSPATTLANVANTTVVSAMPNLGTSGAIYDATSVEGPAVATQNGVKVLQFNSSSYKQLTMATEINLSTNSSVFFVGYQTSTRLIALGGSASSSNGNTFLGWGAANNATLLFRNSTDGGQTLTGLTSVAGLKVFGIIQGTSTFTYYDNSTTPTSGTYVSGTYRFKKLGARDYNGTINGQLSTGYLGDVVAFNRVVSNDEAVLIMKLLKERYNIQ